MWDELPKKTFPPFHQSLKNFCESVSKRLFEHPDLKRMPDIAALAFWMRKAHVEELEKAFLALQPIDQRRVPRGTVLHIAPSNVEVMFVYSWILALLTGNANIVRLPTRRSLGSEALLKTLEEVLQHYPDIRSSTLLVSYGHDEGITAALSAEVDVRILWGGDKTIQIIRRIPLKLTAKELVFADRFAYAALHASSYLSLKDPKPLHQAFYNDMYWYDQCACSSPRAIFWIGSGTEIKQAQERFFPALQQTLEEKHYRLPLSLVLKKEAFLYSQALTTNLQKVRRFSNELTVLELSLTDKVRENPGLGLLYSFPVPSLDALVDFVSPKDQTLTTFGFVLTDLQAFSQKIQGKGIDRIVPIGQALSFDYIWDGYDLLHELTRMRFLALN